MKKLSIASIVVLTLVFSLPVSQSFAAVKSGQPCSKLKSIVKQSGRTYTCIQVGRKKVWSKGITRTSQAPIPLPAPTVLPTAVFPKAPTSFDDLVENYSGIAYAAWKKSRDLILATATREPKFFFHVGPNTKATYSSESAAFDLVARMHAQFEMAPDLNVVLFNFVDREWAKSKMDALGFEKDSSWVTQSGCTTEPMCWGGAVFIDKDGRQILMLTTGSDRNHTEGTLQAHEFAHTLQLWAVRARTSSPEGKPWPPTWLLEGQAQFVQNAAIFNQSYENYLDRRRDASQDLFNQPIHTAAYIEQYFQVDQSGGWFDKYPRWRQYDLGAMLVEALVALKGPEAVMEIFRKAGAGTGFAQAFEEVFGLPWQKALPVIAQAIALEIGHG